MTIDLPIELKLYGKPRNFERILLLILVIIWIPFSIKYNVQLMQNIIVAILIITGIIISFDKIWIIKENKDLKDENLTIEGFLLIEKLNYTFFSFQARKHYISDSKIKMNIALNNHPYSCNILILESNQTIHKLKFSKKQVNETKDFFELLGIDVKISKFTMKR